MKTILLDIDGVLADFVTGSIEACGLPITHDEVTQWNYYEPYMTKEEFWKRIHAQKYFWEDLPVYPGAHLLVEVMKQVGAVYFCSDPSGDDEAATGKIRWLKRHGFVNPGEDNYILTPHKHLLAGPNVVLVDDYAENVKKFRDRGGEGVLYPQRWNLGWTILDYMGGK